MLAVFGGEGLPAEAQAVRPPTIDLEYQRAENAWKSGGSLLEAKVRLDRVLDAAPQDAEALKLRARVLLQMDRPEDALADAREAVRVAVDDGEAHLVMSEAARLTGDRALARAELDAAADRITTGADLHVRLSWNAAMLGQLDRAEAFGRVALAQDPSNAEAYYQLARVFMQRGEPDQATSVLCRGLDRTIIEARVIREDALLSRLVGREALAPYL